MEYQTVDEMRRSYAEISKRLWNPKGAIWEDKAEPQPPAPPPEPKLEIGDLGYSAQIILMPWKDASPRINFNDVLGVVCWHYGCTTAELFSRRRQSVVIRRRHVAWALARDLCLHMSLPMIARLSGDYDHTTIMNGSVKGKLYEEYGLLRDRLEQILAEKQARYADMEKPPEGADHFRPT